jgi:hypothetical protein
LHPDNNAIAIAVAGIKISFAFIAEPFLFFIV